jgi:hypothetical protein
MFFRYANGYVNNKQQKSHRNATAFVCTFYLQRTTCSGGDHDCTCMAGSSPHSNEGVGHSIFCHTLP